MAKGYGYQVVPSTCLHKGYEIPAAEPIYSDNVQVLLQDLMRKQQQLSGCERLLLMDSNVCQQQPNGAPDREQTQQALLGIGQKLAAMTAAAMLMVEPASARPGQSLINSARKTQQEFEEIFKSRGGFPQVNESKKDAESSLPSPQETEPQEFKLLAPVKKATRIQGDNLRDRAKPEPVKRFGQAEPKAQPEAGANQTASALNSGEERKAAKQEAKDKKFAEDTAETQDQMKGPSPPQIAPKQSDATESTFNPIKSAFPLDPAAPVGKSAQRTQEINKTPTPPPQQDKDAPEPVPTALGGTEGNPSPPPALTANIEAETDKNSETPAVQALIEGQGTDNGVKPEQIAKQVEEAGKVSEGSDTPAGGFAGFFEAFKSNFRQPSQSDQGTTDQPVLEAASKATDVADEAVKNVSSEVPDASNLAETASESVKSVADAAPEAAKLDPAGNPFTQLVDGLKSTFPPEQSTQSVGDRAQEAAAQSVGDSVPEIGGKAEDAVQSVSDAVPDSSSLGGKTDDAVQSVTDAAPEAIKPNSSRNLFAQFVDSMKSTFPPESSTAGSAAEAAAQSVRESAPDGINNPSDKAEDAVQSVSDSVPDSGDLGRKAEGAAQSVTDAVQKSESSGNLFSQFVDSMKSTFPPEQSTQSASGGAAQAVSDSASDSGSSLGGKAQDAAQSVTAALPDSYALGGKAEDAAQAVTEAAPDAETSEAPGNPISQFAVGLKSAFLPEQSMPSTADNAQEAAPSDMAGEAVSDSVFGGLSDAVQKAPDSMKAVNDEPAEAQGSEGPAVSGITSFLDTVKDKLQPDDSPAEAASAAAQSVGDSVPDSSSLGGKAEEAAQTVRDSVPDSIREKAEDAVQSVSNAVPDSSSLGGKAEEAAQTVSDSVPDSINAKAGSKVQSVSDSEPDSSNPGGKAEEAVQSVSDSVPDSSSLGEKAEGAVQSVSDSISSLGEKANDAVQSVGDSVPDNSSHGGKAEDAVQSVSDSVPDSISEKGEDAVQSVSDSSDVGGKAEDAVQSVGDSVPESGSLNGKVEDAVQSVGDSFSSLGEKAKDVVQSVGDSVPDSSSLGSKAEEAVQSVSDAVPDSSSLGGKAEESVQSVSDSVPDSSTLGGKAEEAVQTVSDSVPDSSSLGGKAEEAVNSVGDSVPDSSSLGGKAEEAVQSVSDSVPGSSSQGGKAGSAVQSVSNSEPDSWLSGVTEDAAQSVGKAASSLVGKAGSAIQSATCAASTSLTTAADTVTGAVQSINAPNEKEVLDSAPAEPKARFLGFVNGVKEKLQPAQPEQSAELGGKAGDAIAAKLPESMGRKDKLENVAPDSLPGKFVGLVDNLRSRLQPEQQSTQSTPGAEAPDSNSNSPAADSITKEVSDNISESIGSATPSKGASSPEASNNNAGSISDALTSVSQKVSSAAGDALDQAESSFGANPLEEVSAGAGAAIRDAVKDESNPANTGAAPSQAAPTASDPGSKAPGVQSVADPADVKQALDSVGDAVENAVPDPKGAESGLAPVDGKQVSTTEDGGSIRDALSPGLAEVTDTAQRKVQEATPELEDPSQGIAAATGAAKKATASFAASVMPIQPAGAATLDDSFATRKAPAYPDIAAEGSAPASEAAGEAATEAGSAVSEAGPDTSKGLLISVGAVAVLAVVTFSLTGKPSVVKQAADAANKVKDLNEF
ncbi:hypothetical protein ABBQ32_000694 [Trebouxia sp. C0010 RCD-2024]